MSRALAPSPTVVTDLPRLPTYIGTCCREWVLASMHVGRCGLCGAVPTYTRPDDHPANPIAPGVRP